MILLVEAMPLFNKMLLKMFDSTLLTVDSSLLHVSVFIVRRINRFFVKLLQTGDITIVQSCHSYFSFNLPSVLLKNRAEKLDIKYKKNHANLLCQMVEYL